MRKNNNKVVLVTGASSGIGEAIALLLANNNYTVYGTSRNATSPDAYPFNMLVMDVRDDNSVKNAIESLISKENKLDVLINNAGIGVAGYIEDCSIQIAKEQFETNFFGVFRVCKAVLPIMREMNCGLIININSLGGLFGLPLQGLYSASKFALEGFTQSLRMELMGTSIKIVSVNPGDISTPFTQNRIKVNLNKLKESSSSSFKKGIGVIESDEKNGLEPKKVAKLIYKIIQTKRPKTRYLVGRFPQVVIPFIKTILPVSLFEKMISVHYHINKT